jgi:hypothetical protein
MMLQDPFATHGERDTHDTLTHGERDTHNTLSHADNACTPTSCKPPYIQCMKVIGRSSTTGNLTADELVQTKDIQPHCHTLNPKVSVGWLASRICKAVDRP